jgi:hypothetical protein
MIPTRAASFRYISLTVNLRTSILLGLGTVFLSDCRNLPEPYGPPDQRPAFDHFEPYHVSRIVDMADGNADQYIVRDILGASGSWRWCRQHPEVRLSLRTNKNLRYTIDFTIVEATFKDTGPLEFSFYVNGRLLDQKRYTSAGSQHFEKPIPDDWVQPGKENLVGAEVDKVWISPADHEALGFILSRIGLAQE